MTPYFKIFLVFIVFFSLGFFAMDKALSAKLISVSSDNKVWWFEGPVIGTAHCYVTNPDKNEVTCVNTTGHKFHCEWIRDLDIKEIFNNCKPIKE